MTKRAPVGTFGNRGWFWSFIASWFIPLTMTIAYIVLALTSETDATGWAWMSIGLAFVLCLWFMFRMLTRSAAMSRAIAVGDAERIVEIAGDSPVYRGLAHHLKGEWTQALAAVAEAKPDKPRDQVLAATVKIGALVETGEVARARAVLDGDLPKPLARLDERMDAQSHILARLARGRVLAAERASSEARATLQKVIDDVRTGSATRAIAHHYAARAAAADGDHAAADRHRAKAAELAPGTWIAG